MTFIKIIEKITEAEKSWEDATQKAVEKASKSLCNIRSVWVKDLSTEVENGKITSYRLNCKLSFEKDDD